jgi:RNA polymerase sigma factor (sigma-70 family)
VVTNSDEIYEWVAAAQQGDSHALDRLLEHYRPLVWRYLRARLRSEEDCHDLTQQVLLRVVQALPRTQLHAPFEYWLMRIAANCLATFYRQQAHHPETLFSDLPDPEWAVEVQQLREQESLIQQMSVQQSEQRLQAIIAQVCSRDEQRVLRLHAQGEPMDAVARMLHLNLNTARTHLMRGRAKVLAYIVQYEPELVGGASAIDRAIERLGREGAPREQLTPQEYAALRHPQGNQKLLRRACLKIARFLSI